MLEVIVVFVTSGGLHNFRMLVPKGHWCVLFAESIVAVSTDVETSRLHRSVDEVV